MQNLMMVFTFSVLDSKQPFWANLVQQIKIAGLSWNFSISINSNMQNSMVVFTFSDFYRKHSFLLSLWPHQSGDIEIGSYR